MKRLISLKAFAEKLKTEKSVAIFSHVRPDGDTVGSALALSLALKSLGIKTSVYCTDEIPERFLSFHGATEIKSELQGEYSAFLAIDSADITRIGDFAVPFSAHKNTYSLDHHVSNRGYAKYHVMIDTAANCENVYSLILELGVEITKDIADCLALGIVTDTGNFKHNNVTPETFYIASKLREKGADFNYIVFKTFTEQSKYRAKLFGLTMSSIRYFLDDKLAFATITQENIEKSGAKPDETEGFIDFIMGITGVEVGVCALETGVNSYKISFRSKKTDVNAIANAFGGGGHVNASGCKIRGEYEEVVDKIYCAVKRFIEI